MEKRLFAVIALVLTVGAAFAQSPADSIKTVDVPKERPHLRYKVKPDHWANKWGRSKGNKLPDTARAKSAQPEDVTPFYSNMPIAKVGKKRDLMPLAPVDSTVHYHLRKKRYQVLPIPGTPEQPSERETKR